MDDYSSLKEPVNTKVHDVAIACPMCGESSVPKYIYGIKRELVEQPNRMIVLAICKRSKCKMPYLLNFELVKQDGYNPNASVEWYGKPLSYDYHQFVYEPEELAPYSEQNEKRPYYTNFIKIYSQAYSAEASDLDEISGMGYRKSLEFLLKDYTIHLNPDKEEQIKKQALSDVIVTYLSNNSFLVKTARAASWLGNDQTHYVKKWVSKDVSDLKKLILATLHWIEQTEISKEYISDMGLD